MERTRKTSEELDGRRRESCVQIRTQRHEQQEREREKERERERGRDKFGHKMERTRGTSTETDVPKATTTKNIEHGERSEGMGDKEVPMPRSTQEEEQ